MAADRVADLTVEDLRSLIADMIDERLKEWPGQLRDTPISQVLADIRQSVWQRPADSQSSLDLLREDRNR